MTTGTAAEDPWRDHRLTGDEQGAFERDGFLALPHALGAAQVSALVDAAHREDERYRRAPDVGPHHVLNLHDLIDRDAAFYDLMDCGTTLPKVLGVLGWNIQLHHTQLVVTPPAPAGAVAGPYGWHRDNNRMNQELDGGAPHPRVSVKVAYFLSNLPEAGMGNLCVVPGSHRLIDQPSDRDALELTGRAGDAVLFDRRLWHSATTNVSSTTRVVLFYGYSYRWLRPKSAIDIGAHGAEPDPIRRQLLGAATSANGYYEPLDADVPLRALVED
jgi:hypothetical protein